MPTSAIMTNTSGIAIKDAFDRIALSQIPNQRWLGDKNYYKRDTKNKVDKEIQASLTKRKKQIAEYIAASVIVHSSDGWTYLSRAMESLINGDLASSVHFAYYAELRSAMSLMAYDGVGVFNRKHVWFNSLGNPTLFGGFTTHSAVDNGMKEWAKVSSKKDVIFSLVKVNNKSLSEWIRETGFSARSAYSSTVANRWLKKWSIDLHLKEDQYLRNEMSYRPHFDTSKIDIQTTVNKLIDIWNLLEPTSANRFPLLDKHLLRLSLEEIYKKITYTAPVGLPYENFLKNIFNRLGEDTTQVLFNFLTRALEPNDHLIFDEAKKDQTNISINKDDPFPIICRAILLLRISTGAANQLITESPLDSSVFRFWWEKLSLELGNTSIIPSGIDAIELYSDIRDSVEEINLKSLAGISCVKEAFSEMATPLFYLKQFQRTAIWGMGL